MTELTFDLWNFIGGLVAGGIGGALVTLKLTKIIRSEGNGTSVDQTKVNAGGDVIGRDKRG